MSRNSSATGSQGPSVVPSSSAGHLSIDIDKVSREMRKETQERPSAGEKMRSEILECPKLLRKNAGERSCCIFRVPQSLIDINDKAYYPRIVSIGPYHHGNDRLKMFQEHKRQYLGAVDKRMQQNGHQKALDEFLEAIGEKEDDIRKCYSEVLEFDSTVLAKMMVVDGIFIIELFCKVVKLVKMEVDDPIFSMQWVLPFLHRDFLGLENQIPFFVLQILFDKSAPSRAGFDKSSTESLTSLALEFFNVTVQRPEQVINRLTTLQPKLEGVHLLDLFRLSYIRSMAPSDPTTSSDTTSPAHQSSIEMVQSTSTNVSLPSSNQSTVQPSAGTSTNTTSSLRLLPSALKLRRAGIKIKVRKANCFLDIKYSHRSLRIPQITIDEMAQAFILNFVAFEQCYHYCSNHMTDYAYFMGGLVSTPSDTEILCDKGIIENYFSTHEEVTNLFYNACKDIPFDVNNSYLSKVYEDVNESIVEGRCWKWFPELWDTHCRSPWSITKVLAATAILGLTAAQVYYAARSENNLPARGFLSAVGSVHVFIGWLATGLEIALTIPAVAGPCIF